jgi:hypothetical protein
MFQHPVTDEPCQCYDFTITITVTAKVSTEHLPGRLTEEDIVNKVAKRSRVRIADSRRG